MWYYWMLCWLNVYIMLYFLPFRSPLHPAQVLIQILTYHMMSETICHHQQLMGGMRGWPRRLTMSIKSIGDAIMQLKVAHSHCLVLVHHVTRLLWRHTSLLPSGHHISYSGNVPHAWTEIQGYRGVISQGKTTRSTWKGYKISAKINKRISFSPALFGK